MFNFEPIPESELSSGSDSWKNIKEGEVNFKLVSHEIQGNGNVKLEFRVKDSEGNSGRFRDTFSPNTQWKILNFLKSVGKKDLYSRGGIDFENLLSSEGRCMLANNTFNGKTYLQIASYLEYDGIQDPYKSVCDWDDGDEIPF